MKQERVAEWVRSRVFVPSVFLGLTLALFCESLFFPNDRVLSAKADICQFFLYWREFGFGEMKAGSYSRYWRAVPLPGSSQSRYQILPADWTLMAIPLGAGRHSFRMEYAPSGFIIGRWISLVSLLAYLIALGAFVWRRRLSHESDSLAGPDRSDTGVLTPV